MLGWVPSNNPFETQWQVVPLRAAAAGVENKRLSSTIVYGNTIFFYQDRFGTNT